MGLHISRGVRCWSVCLNGVNNSSRLAPVDSCKSCVLIRLCVVRGSVLVEALRHKSEGRGFET
jgi:hypothetical protein